ncbi:hypothetical protein V8C37DRAFT_93981 [Trichoderma ceciliae]
MLVTGRRGRLAIVACYTCVLPRCLFFSFLSFFFFFLIPPPSPCFGFQLPLDLLFLFSPASSLLPLLPTTEIQSSHGSEPLFKYLIRPSNMISLPMKC